MPASETLANRDTIISRLADIVGEGKLRLQADDLHSFGRDWTRVHEPRPLAVVLPRSVEEVQAIVRLANELHFALVPSGGRTGLSGGAMAANGEVVVAFDAMNKILDFNPVDRTVLCQAGVVTAELQQYAEQQGLFYPVDFASSGSSRLGGNIGTNAGGIKVIRYGMTRDWVVGLKVVTGSGELLELNRGLRKNNSGYDLRHLFIGSEGTLGLVVEATMQLTRQPADLTALVLGVPDFASLMKIFGSFQQRLDLTAFEFFSEPALKKVVAHQGLNRPFPDACNFYALIEYERTNDQVEEQAMALFEEAVEQGWATDGVMSQSIEQLRSLWRLREDISETLARWTPYKNDLATRIADVPPFLEAVDALVRAEHPQFEVIWFGHIGDGNMHLNILKPEAMDKDDFFAVCAGLGDKLFDLVRQFGGSISAEHGIGLLKKPYLHYSVSAEEVAVMKQIKQVFDPNGVMNPGKIFD